MKFKIFPLCTITAKIFDIRGFKKSESRIDFAITGTPLWQPPKIYDKYETHFAKTAEATKSISHAAKRDMEPRTPESDGTSANNVSPNDEVSATPGTSVKLKNYTFCKEAKVILLKSVRQFDAHLANYEENRKFFDKVHEQFISNLPVTKKLYHAHPSVKTLRDKFRATLTARRTTNRNNATAPGIAEAVTEEK